MSEIFQTMNNLTEENKQHFEKQISKITSKDEKKVLANINNEIEKLKSIAQANQSHRIKNLIDNANLLLNILMEPDFPMDVSTRKWIIFGLGYLISDFDLIPDAIPYIGYNDDSLVLQWVIYMIDKDISRYNVFKNAKQLANEGGIIENLKTSESDSILVFISGFIDGLKEPLSDNKILTQTAKLKSEIKNSSVYSLRWNLGHLKEFSDIIRIVDHQMTLKPSFDSEVFNTEWLQLKAEFRLLGEAMAIDLQKIKGNKKIILITFNVGCIAAERALQLLPENFIEEFYCFGGTSRIDQLPHMHFSKINHVYNFFSTNDFALKFIFDNFEKTESPIGLAPLILNNEEHIKNFNISEFITNHSDYLNKFADFI